MPARNQRDKTRDRKSEPVILADAFGDYIDKTETMIQPRTERALVYHRRGFSYDLTGLSVLWNMNSLQPVGTLAALIRRQMNPCRQT